MNFLISHFYHQIIAKHVLRLIYETRYSKIDHIKFVEDSLLKILLALFWNTLSHIIFTVINVEPQLDALRSKLVQIKVQI